MCRFGCHSGAIQHRTTFTSPLFRKLLGSSWKIYLHILRISIPRAYPRASWSLNTWFHCGPLTSLFLDSVILRDVYGVARYGHLVGHCFFEESLIHSVDLFIPYLLLKVSFRGSQMKSPFWFSVLRRRNQPGLIGHSLDARCPDRPGPRAEGGEAQHLDLGPAPGQLRATGFHF